MIRLGRRFDGARVSRPFAFMSALADFVAEGLAARRADIRQRSRVDPPVDHVRHPLAERFPCGNNKVNSLAFGAKIILLPQVSQEYGFSPINTKEYLMQK